MYFSSDCFLESVGNCQPEKFVKSRKNIKVSPHFEVSVPYFGSVVKSGGVILKKVVSLRYG